MGTDVPGTGRCSEAPYVWMTKPDAEPGPAGAAARSRYLEAFEGAPDGARLIKLADRTGNVKHLDRHPRPAKRRSYYRQWRCAPTAGISPRGGMSPVLLVHGRTCDDPKAVGGRA
ncbi:MAG: hypothetical protein ACRDJO_11460 [Actinomycetota bacterium]